MRDGALGPRDRLDGQPFPVAAARKGPRRRLGAHREGAFARSEDRARRPLHRGGRSLLPKPGKGRRPHAPARVRGRDGRAGAPLPRRHRGADPACAGGLRELRSERQELRQPEEGRRDPRADLGPAARPSRRRALHRALVRLPADRAPRRAGGTPLLGDRRFRAARAAHAFAHLHPGRAWRESIASNRMAAKIAAASDRQWLHANDYMVYAHLQLGQEREAKAIVDQVLALQRVPEENFVAAHAVAAIPARYAVERGRCAGRGATSPSARPNPTSRGSSFPMPKQSSSTRAGWVPRGPGTLRALVARSSGSPS